MRFLLLSVLIFANAYAGAQTLTGSWYGRADAVLEGSHNNYLSELIIKQKGDVIEGIFGYYFRNGYKSQFVRGVFDKKTRQFVFNKIPLTYFRAASIDGVDCMMNFYGTVLTSKVQTSINGLFTTDPRYTYTCPEIKVIYTLDFAEKNQDSLIQNSIARKVWQPQPEDVVVNTAPLAADTPVNDSAAIKNAAQLQALVANLEKRETVVSREVEIESDSVRISFYDNGDIDGDSISVFVNKLPILTKKSLTAQALNIYLTLDSTKGTNEITMFAENLGKYPPNTALMVVNDGDRRHEVYLSSSLTQNASVRLRRKKRL